MTWQLAIFAHLLFTTWFALDYRSFTQKNNKKAFLYTALMYLLVVWPAGILVALALGDISFDHSLSTWFFLALVGVMFAIANIVAFTANSKIDAAQFSIIGNLRQISVVALSGWLLAETVNARQGLGIVLILGAAVWIALLRIDRKTWTLDRHTLLAVLSATLFGAGIVNVNYLLDQMNYSSYLLLSWTFQTAALMVIAGRRMREIKQEVRGPHLWPLLQLGALRTFAGFSFIYALSQSDNTPVVASVASYKTALVVVSSYFILKERTHTLVKIAATALATAGLLLLI